MSLLRTPVGVTTRQQEKRKQRMMTSQDDDKRELELPVQPESVKMSGSQASRSSSSAARKRLELQAARRKAEIEMKALELEAQAELAVKKSHIEMDLVNKELEAELADLEFRSASHRSSASSRTNVEDWLEKSVNDVEKTGEPECEQAGDVTRDIVNPVRNSGVPQRNDIRELATALKEAITLSAPKSNQELLTRLATSKDLPVYFGDPLEWLQFREAFYESTQLCNYSDTENIWRLRKCLRGEAKEAVSALLIGQTTPHIILDTLELRFGRPEVVMHKIVAQLRRLPPLSPSYHGELVQFSIKIKNYVAAASALKQTDYLRSPELVSVVVSKLPTVLITGWADYAHLADESKPRLQHLADFLYMEARKTAASGVSFLQSQSELKRRSENTKHPPHNVLVYANADNNNNCKFCRASKHALEKCAMFKRALRKDRWRFARINKLCYKCLGLRHADISMCIAPNCDIEECGRPHHHLLHWMRPKDHQQPEKQTDETVTHAVANQSVVVPKVLLKVVPLTIYGPKGSAHIHALLDDGSTVTLLSADVANKVGLHGESVTMRARGAWNIGELICETEIVNFDVTNGDGEKFKLRARKMKELNLPVKSLSNIDFEKCEHLDNNYDLCKCDIQPELLIGQDNYDFIAPILCIRGQPGEPYVTKTSLGWCIHGITDKVTNSNLLSDRSNTHVCFAQCEPTLIDRSYRPCRTIANPVAGSAQELPAARAVADRATSEGGTSRVLTAAAAHAAQPMSSTYSERFDCICYDSTHDCCTNADYDLLKLHELVRQFFSLDSIGISQKPRKNRDELRASEILNNTSELIGSQWTVGLPWKSDNTVMPDSYTNASRRLQSVLRKMAASEVYESRYQERVDHLFINKYARPVNAAETGKRIWYLPHFGVDNPNKKKLRLVFDAAAKSHGYSLNDFLLQGPDLLNSLYGIMYRFREYPFAVVGDIKDMFLCIKIRDDDQHALRFLWKKKNEPVKEYAMTSLIFGANCSPFVAQYINQTLNTSRFQDVMQAAVHAIQNNQYMDDYIDSHEDKDTAKKIVKEVTYIHQQGGFQMRNWLSNDPSLLEHLPKENISENIEKIMLSNSPERTLGLLWYPASDTFAFDLSLKRIPEDILNFTRIPTKRELLRLVMSIFDIHGFLGPVTVKGKILMQQTWKTNLKWDDKLNEDLFISFAEWLKQLQKTDKLRILRWYFPDSALDTHESYSAVADATSGYESVATSTCATNETDAKSANQTSASETNLQLHVFCDASPHAYAAVAYWRKKRNDGNIVVSFIGSKSRVTPAKPVTIPRLELQGALLACRLAGGIKKEHRLKPDSTFYWTDSTTVLHWIRNENRNYKIFIANRLGEIDELSKINEWHYVPSELNVSDLATKNNDFELSNDSVWFTGPSFLRQDCKRWPQEPVMTPKINETLLETVHAVPENEQNITLYLPVPDPRRFSSWLRLLRATANVLLFIEKCKKRKIRGLNDELMHRGEMLLLRHSQMESFLEEIKLIQHGKELRNDSRLRALTPVLDNDGLLRVSGRIGAAREVTTDVKSPVILDGRHHTARLIVKDYHVRAGHSYNELVVNELRQKYWIVRLRPTVRTVASHCNACRIKKASPCPPRLGDLPEARLTHHQRPFTICGVDLFGPIDVTVGRQKQCRYGVLFTCLTVRAVHIEIVYNLTADALIMALRRMAARRGWPKHVYSDNGTNMRGADGEMKKAIKELDTDLVVSESVNRGVDWHFIPPASPHMGGAWERLIRSVKTALKVVLKERSPKEEVLITFLAEVENMINSRPLTHVSVDPRSQEALTPNHFLIGSSSNLPLPGVFDERDLYLRKQWRISQRLADLFWSRWLKEVLPSLVPRSKWQREGTQLKIGDLVVIVDPSSPRNCWPKGIIEAVYPGRDKRVRVVDVRTRNGVLKRSAARVALLLGDECQNADTRGEDVDDGNLDYIS